MKISWLSRFLLMIILAWAGAVSVAAQETASDAGGAKINQQGTVIYDQEFFARFPNAVTAADLLSRIPGGQQALSGSGGAARGFSRNLDNILINGKRISGKSNDSRSALSRITAGQVERIEVIRGSSPDIKVSSQAAIFNIITREDISGSGSWQAKALILADGSIQPGGQVSYGARSGGFEYFVSIGREPLSRAPVQSDRLFDGGGVFTNQIDELIEINRSNTTFSANLGYTFQNGDQIRLNGQYEKYQSMRTQDGTLFDSDGIGGLVFTGNSFRLEDTSSPEYEIGGDFTKRLSGKWEMKFIGLYSRDNVTSLQAEDFDITGDEIENDVLSIEDKTATETIARISAAWTPNATHSLELGSEIAINKLDAALQFFEREGGLLVEQEVAGANAFVKETRNESFIIHTWQISEKSSLETALFTEWSRISQTGDLNNSRTFFFFRPSFDFRHNVTPRDQIQVSFRRRIGQLNFEDFATTVSKDDEIVGGNPNLVPWKRWEFEIGYEHRLKDDKGFIKVRLFHREIQDALERIEIAPGISGVGNVGDARDFGIALDTSYRLTDLGLRNLVINTEFQFRHVRLRDAFTGEWRRPDWAQTTRLRIDIRHDVQRLSFSWGLSVNRDAQETFHDFDEVIVVKSPRYWMALYVEKQLFRGIILRVNWANAVNPDAGRNRSFYQDGRALGVLTRSELRTLKFGRRVEISLKGTF
ncbi:MAG: TonB-dependent receptor [Proteobacteria bacterium]|nr:TonB-dependent receptor [Pseudomonadota bacterium]